MKKKINKKKKKDVKAKAEKAKTRTKTPRKSVKQSKPKTATLAHKRTKKVTQKIKKLTKNTGYIQLKDGSYRVYGWRVIDVPRLPKFPELVIVESTKRHIKKQFLNMACAVKYIEKLESEKLIDSGGKAVLKELKSLGLGALSVQEINTDKRPTIEGSEPTKEVALIEDADANGLAD